MDKTTLIAIDTGSNGGIVIWKKDRLENVIKMPKNLSDLKTYFDYIKENNDKVIVFIEKVQMFLSDEDASNVGKQYRVQKLLANYNQIKSLVTFYGFPYCEVYPISWQSGLGFTTKGLDSTTRKNLYKKYAEQNFPSADVTLWNSDALCILKFGMFKYENDYNWVLERLENRKKEGLF